MPIELNVNGRVVSVDVPADKPLLWVLREELDLAGTKYGCGMAQCGACTVHVDGVATRSCVLPVSSAEGSMIRTIEGLSVEGTHPVQQAWQDLDVAQCGYCQSGQIMTAVALLARTPSPTDAQVDAAMSGNLCRCATYLRVRAAIKQAAGSTPARPASTRGTGGSR